MKWQNNGSTILVVVALSAVDYHQALAFAPSSNSRTTTTNDLLTIRSNREIFQNSKVHFVPSTTSLTKFNGGIIQPQSSSSALEISSFSSSSSSSRRDTWRSKMMRGLPSRQTRSDQNLNRPMMNAASDGAMDVNGSKTEGNKSFLDKVNITNHDGCF
jgi:hypothetical protein